MFKLVLIALATVSTVGCATFGPKAEITLQKEEIKAVKQVGAIVIANATGIDASGNTGKALMAASVATYGKRARPTAALGAVLKAAGAPEGFSDLVTLDYQIGFAKQCAALKEKKITKSPKSVASLSSKAKLSLDKLDLKNILTDIKKDLTAITGLLGSLKKGDTEAAQKSLDESPRISTLAGQFSGLIMEQLDATYVLTTHVIGSEKDWEAKKPVTLYMGLINTNTRVIRYFGKVDAQKGVVPMPYMAQLTSMASNLLGDVEDLDPMKPYKSSH